MLQCLRVVSIGRKLTIKINFKIVKLLSFEPVEALAPHIWIVIVALDWIPLLNGSILLHRLRLLLKGVNQVKSQFKGVIEHPR
jgi:hypothetical protein